MEKLNKWKRLKEFINSRENGVFTRKEMRLLIDADSTEDQYVNVLRNCQFIVRTSLGKYKRLLKIPMTLSSSKIINLAYDREKRDKYMTILKRKEKLENIKNSQ